MKKLEIYEKKRILQVVGALNIGGAETMLVNVLRNMDRQRCQFDFVVSGNEKGYYEEEIQELGGVIYHVTKRADSIWKHYHQFHSLVKRQKYKIVHIHQQNAFFTVLQIIAAKRAGAEKIITHCHSTNDWRGRSLIFLHKIMRRVVNRLADVRLACGEEAAKWLYGTTKGVGIVPLPVDCSKYIFSEELYRELRDRYGYSGKKVYIHVGRFSDVKNHRFLIEIFEGIKAMNKSSVLFLIGDGELRKDMEKVVKEKRLENDVVFWGNIGDVNEKLLMADAFLFPSKYEGFPTVLLEAQAAGLPCFISDTITKETDITDLIRRISLKKNAGEWASEVIKEHRYIEDRDKYNQIIKEKYDVLVTVEQLMKLYE